LDSQIDYEKLYGISQPKKGVFLNMSENFEILHSD
jgi:hypothetical protein